MSTASPYAAMYRRRGGVSVRWRWLFLVLPWPCAVLEATDQVAIIRWPFGEVTFRRESIRRVWYSQSLVWGIRFEGDNGSKSMAFATYFTDRVLKELEALGWPVEWVKGQVL